jgi:CheY-like chemotaxis protein
VSSTVNGSGTCGGAGAWGNLVVAQLRGITAWLDEAPSAQPRLSREARVDQDRALQARNRERAALLAHLDRQELALVTGQPLPRRPMIVVAHRQPWWRDKARDALDSAGLCVDFVLQDGADVVAVLVAEQPEVVLAEDRLPTVTGIDLVRRASVLSPDSFIALQVADELALQQALDAGARAAYTRQVPPADIAHDIQLRLAPVPQPPTSSNEP